MDWRAESQWLDWCCLDNSEECWLYCRDYLIVFEVDWDNILLVILSSPDRQWWGDWRQLMTHQDYSGPFGLDNSRQHYPVASSLNTQRCSPDLRFANPWFMSWLAGSEAGEGWQYVEQTEIDQSRGEKNPGVICNCNNSTALPDLIVGTGPSDWAEEIL